MLTLLKTLRQAAALPYVWTEEGVEVALITSRERKRWIIPKGWPEKRMTLGDAAAMEAIEEAGIQGMIAAEPLGSFVYQKSLKAGYSVPCRVFVFPLLAYEQRLRWKEKKNRKLTWLPISEAASKVDDKGLARLLTRLAIHENMLPTLTGALAETGTQDRTIVR